jgi:phytoene/squalene synthetase
MDKLYNDVCEKASRSTTLAYSTSFSLGILFLSKKIRSSIFNIYGFVRFADEIVDTFDQINQEETLDEFEKNTFLAINRGFSMNPILHSFQATVNEYNIDQKLITQFLHSMSMDLSPQEYDQDKYEEYILGSAEVVGLMCLAIFTEKDKELYDRLTPSAMKLGSAFQKVNFLRDLKDDYNDLGRTYFPGVDLTDFDNSSKSQIEQDIQSDFDDAFEGIIQLPKNSRFGVYLAYKYYLKLFKKIQRSNFQRLLQERVRIPNQQKFSITIGSFLKHQLNLL